MDQGRDLGGGLSSVGAPRRTDHAAPPRVSLVPGAGIQTVGEGLQGPVLAAMQLPPARASLGRPFQTVWNTSSSALQLPGGGILIGCPA
jgi:hypothetical protein